MQKAIPLPYVIAFIEMLGIGAIIEQCQRGNFFIAAADGVIFICVLGVTIWAMRQDRSRKAEPRISAGAD